MTKMRRDEMMNTNTQDANVPTPHPGVRNIAIDTAAAHAHVMQPPHVRDVISDKGREEAELPSADFLTSLTGQHLNVDAFGKALHAALKDSVVGYTMQLRRSGTPIYTLVWNWAKMPVDGNVGFTLDRQMHIASVSKLMTGVAMTKVLDDKNLSYDTPIISYLPKYWAKGVGINQITFRHLLTHRSGFNTGGSGSDFPLMKSKIAAGVSGVGTYHYENMNFGLCRILISVINGNIGVDTTFQSNNDANWDYVTIQAYNQYAQQTVFGSSSVTRATLAHPSDTALAYKFPASDSSGWNSGDLSTMSGGAGWHMSVNEVLNVMGAFRRKGTIMTATRAQALLDNMFGIDVTLNTSAGKLYNKNGLWQDGAGRTEQCLAYFLPEDMELVVFANSPIGAPAQFFRTVVTNISLANLTSSLSLAAADEAIAEPVPQV